MNEIWKAVVGFEGLYEVSNLGNVRNKKQHILSTYINRDGYVKIQFKLKYKRYIHFVHRLVALAFILNPNNKETINHIDGNKKNNNVLNLEWATRSENTIHAYKNNLIDKNKLKKFGNDNSNNKNVIQYSLSGTSIKEYVSLSEASNVNKIDVSDICKVCKNKKKSAGGYIWKYKTNGE